MPAPIQLLFDLGLEDLNPIVAGESINFPDRHVWPTLFNAVIIHYVRRGRGTLYSRGQQFEIRAGQAFIMLPGENGAHYKSDHNDPWEYAWIGFTGKLAYRFAALPPVFTPPEGSFPHLQDLRNASKSLGYLLAGDLLTLYGKLLEPHADERNCVQMIKEHIEKNYMQKLIVEDFAQRFNRNRRYLSQQFKEETGVSIRTYLTQIRLEKAKEFLARGKNTKATALACGFSNTSNFHKMFTAFYGMTPLQWKQQAEKSSIDL